MSGADCRGQVFNEAAASIKQHGQNDDDESGHDAPPPPPTPLHTDVRAQRSKGSILDSLLEISLENEDAKEGGTPPQRQGGSMPSAARTMIELKAIEKMRNQMNALDPVPARGGASPAAGYGGGGGAAGGAAGAACEAAAEGAAGSHWCRRCPAADSTHRCGERGAGIAAVLAGGTLCITAVLAAWCASWAVGPESCTCCVVQELQPHAMAESDGSDVQVLAAGWDGASPSPAGIDASYDVRVCAIE